MSLTMILAVILLLSAEPRKCHTSISSASSFHQQSLSTRVGFTFHTSSSSPLLRKSLRPKSFSLNHVLSSISASFISPSSLSLGTSFSSTDADETSSGDENIISSPNTAVPTSAGLIVDADSGEYDGSSILSGRDDKELDDEAFFDQLFDSIAKQSERNSETSSRQDHFKLVDFIEQSVGIQGPRAELKKIRGRAKNKENVLSAISSGGDEEIQKEREFNKSFGSKTNMDDRQGALSEADLIYVVPDKVAAAREPMSNPSLKLSANRRPEDSHTVTAMEEQPPPSVNENREAPYNVVCTHITADFDTLASAIGLAKLWNLGIYNEEIDEDQKGSVVHGPLPTYVVLPRGAHPDVQRFLSLHKHLFPIRSLKSLPGFADNELKKVKSADQDNLNEGLQRVGLVDAQRRDRLGPAEILLPHAKLGVTIVDHHVDAESDIEQARHYVVENVGSVSTMIAERIRNSGIELTEAEATILALGIHSDTGSLVYDSTVGYPVSVMHISCGISLSPVFFRLQKMPPC